MLSIDLRPSNLNPNQILLKQVPSQPSLNRLQRLKELIRVNQENKVSAPIMHKTSEIITFIPLIHSFSKQLLNLNRSLNNHV